MIKKFSKRILCVSKINTFVQLDKQQTNNKNNLPMKKKRNLIRTL